MFDANADIVRIVNSAPPGELVEVLNDLKIIHNNPKKVEKGFTTWMSNSEVYCHRAVSKELKTNTFSFPASSLGSLKYYNSRTKQSYSLDPVTGALLSVKPHSWSGEDGKLVKDLYVELDKYISDHYPGGVVSVISSGNIVSIGIENSISSKVNFWSTIITSVWKITMSESGAVLNGTLCCKVHYYEDGNVQFNSSTPLNDSMKFNSLDSKAFQIVSTISKLEGEAHRLINLELEELNQDALKSLRRALPRTKTKIDWQKIGNYRISHDIDSYNNLKK